MNFVNKIVGFLHLIISIIFAMYGVFFKKSWFDYVYIIGAALVIISWTFYNSECLLTYYIKKYYDKDYKAGKDPTDAMDMYLLLGNKQMVYIITTILMGFNAVSYYIVLSRNNFPRIMYYGFPLSYLFYAISARMFTNLYKNTMFLFIQNLFKLIFIVYLFVILSKIYF